MLAFAIYDDSGTPDDAATPTVAVYVAPNGTSATPPTVVNLGDGMYGFESGEADEAEGRAYRVDTGGQPAHYAGSLGRARFVGFGLYDVDGSPLVGASPSFAAYMSTAGAPLTPPSINDLGGGLYGFSPSVDDVQAGGVVYAITTGAEPAHLGGSALPSDFDPVSPADTGEVRICNLALVRVGSTALILSLDEDTTEARVCKALWASVRDEVLSAHQWPFAMRRATLTQLVGQGRKGWRGVFALPADLLLAHGLWAGTRSPPADRRVPYAIEHGISGQVLLTDEAEPELRYTARVVDASRFPPLFVEALAWRLASDLVLSIPVKPHLGPMAQQRYLMALQQAQAASFRDQQEDQPPESEFIRARS